MSALDLLPCPFCGEVPQFPSGGGTQYELTCKCGIPCVSVQICDLMTIEERLACDPLTAQNDYSYPAVYIERAKQEAITAWNTRAPTSK